jgi:flagellin
MAMVVNTNLPSLNAQRNLQGSSQQLGLSLQRLSSGLRVNSAKDDAAGLAVSEGLSSLVRGNTVAVRNANDGISVGQTAEGALGQISNNLQRIREIAVQAANGSISDSQRGNLQKEVDQLTQEISRITQTTNFNGQVLLSAAQTLTFQIGASGTVDNQVTISTADLTTLSAGYNADLTATGTIDVTNSGTASAWLSAIDDAMSTITTQRATFGGVQNRFEAVISNLSNYNENLTAARSRIMDTDYAAETANLTRNQILQQAGTAILAQANQLPQSALQLLK